MHNNCCGSSPEIEYVQRCKLMKGSVCVYTCVCFVCVLSCACVHMCAYVRVCMFNKSLSFHMRKGDIVYTENVTL